MNNIKTVLKVNGVSKKYNVYKKNIERIKGVILGSEPSEVKNALCNVSFEVKEGERVIIMGPVDSGRSTLAKVIGGVTFPSKGTVDVFSDNMNVMLDAKVGFDTEFSCRDNIFLKANVVGISRKEIDSHVDEILDFAEVTKFADLPMKNAPKGTVALMSLAVNLVKESDFLVIDEVFTGGGNRIFRKCFKRLADYVKKRENITMIMVSNRAPVDAMVGRGIVLEKGKIIFDGDIEEARVILKSIKDIK